MNGRPRSRSLVVLSGWLILLCLALILLSGLLLGWSYVPTAAQAHASVVDLESTSALGRAARAVHLIATHAAIALCLLHLLLVVARSSFGDDTSPNDRSDPDRRAGWISGLLALGALLALAFGGRILPWDEHGGVSLVLAESFFAVGAANPVAALLGEGPLRLQRLWMIHLVGSTLLVLCVVIHAPVRRRLAAWWSADDPWRPAARALAALTALLLTAALVHAPLGPPFRLEEVAAGVAAQWYLRWLQVLSVSSTGLAQVALVLLCALGLATPVLARLLGRGRLRAVWLVLLAGLVVISLLPVRG